MKVVILLAVLAVAAAYPAAQRPAGVYPAAYSACPNYPHCNEELGLNYATGIAYRSAGNPYSLALATVPATSELLNGPYGPVHAIIMRYGGVPQVSWGGTA